MDFQARLEHEARYEDWRQGIKEEVGATPARAASTVFVWMLQTEDGRRCVRELNDAIAVEIRGFKEGGVYCGDTKELVNWIRGLKDIS